MSDQQEQIKGRLFLYGALEPRDELDEVRRWLHCEFNDPSVTPLLLQRLEKCHKDMVSAVGHLREVEAYNQLNDKVLVNYKITYCCVQYVCVCCR